MPYKICPQPLSPNSSPASLLLLNVFHTLTSRFLEPAKLSFTMGPLHMLFSLKHSPVGPLHRNFPSFNQTTPQITSCQRGYPSNINFLKWFPRHYLHPLVLIQFSLQHLSLLEIMLYVICLLSDSQSNVNSSWAGKLFFFFFSAASSALWSYFLAHNKLYILLVEKRQSE